MLVSSTPGAVTGYGATTMPTPSMKSRSAWYAAALSASKADLGVLGVLGDPGDLGSYSSMICGGVG